MSLRYFFVTITTIMVLEILSVMEKVINSEIHFFQVTSNEFNNYYHYFSNVCGLFSVYKEKYIENIKFFKS